MHFGLGFSKSSSFSTNIFAGPSCDSYQKVIYVQVYDNDGAFTTYEIPVSITVNPDLTDIETVMEKLISFEPYFSTNILLSQGSYLESIQIIQKISSLLNIQSNSEKFALFLNNSILFPQIYGPMENYTGVSPVITFILLFLLKQNIFILEIDLKAQKMNIFIYNINRNKRANTRDALVKFINDLSISDMDSVRTQLGLLSLISGQTDELSRASGVLKYFSEKKKQM